MDNETSADTPLPAHLSELTCAQLIALLVERDDRVPRALIDECARRGDEMVQVLDRLIDDQSFWREDVASGTWWLRLHAAMILGLIASARAGVALVRHMRRSASADDEDLLDWVSDAWPALFANKPQSTIDAVRNLALDSDATWYIRACAFDVVAAAAQALSPDALEQTLDWLAGVAANEQQDWDVRMAICHLLLNFPRARHRALLDRLAAEQTGAYQDFGEIDVSQSFERMEDRPDWSRFADPWQFYTPEAMDARRQRWEEDAESGWAEEDEEPADADLFGDALDTAVPPLRAVTKVGRNDPCPCGSGKKYKHCHLHIDQAVAPEDLVWRRVRRAIADLQAHLLDAAVEYFGRDAVDEAWRAFTLGSAGEQLDPDSPHVEAFGSWLCFVWRPDAQRAKLPAALQGKTAAQAYLAARGKRLDPLARRYVEACEQLQFSFHEVLSSEPGRGFRLKDLLLDETRYVHEASASQDAARGDILYASVVEIDGIALLEGCGTVLIPPQEKPRLIALRETLTAHGTALDRARLRECDADVRAVYIGLAERLLNPAMPALRNTDGEPVEWRTLTYEIASAREAFDALKDLAHDESEDALLREALFDRSGALARVEIPWRAPGNPVHKSWPNTVLGSLLIDGTRLTAEVNSAERAQRLEDLIAARLGERARKLPEVIQSMQSLLEREPTPQEQAARRRSARESAELNSLPEVRALIADKLREHYRDWVDQPIPALDNRTPREAMRSANGREAVEALVRQIERDTKRMQPEIDQSITLELRATLGLPAEEED